MLRITALIALASASACTAPQEVSTEPNRLPSEAAVGTYSIAGSVVEAGSRPMTPGDTVLDAVIREQDGEALRSLKAVRLGRDLEGVDPLVVLVPVAPMVATGDTTYNIRLQSGDLLEFLTAEEIDDAP